LIGDRAVSSIDRLARRNPIRRQRAEGLVALDPRSTRKRREELFLQQVALVLLNVACGQAQGATLNGQDLALNANLECIVDRFVDATARILATQLSAKRLDGRIEDDPLTLSAQGS
jgi:hypothetical protein